MACISYNVGTSVKFFGSHHHRSSRPFRGIHRCCNFRNSSSLFYVKPPNSSFVNLHGPRDSQLFNSSQCFSTVFNSISSDNGMPEERMVVLVIGGGGRKHALCYSLKRSPSCDGVFCAPGNAGISSSGDATCISDLDTSDSLVVISFCEK
ncbi:phosphoribosylamine--glycine ligase, chloroplastic-like [Camellia sinensis]|uniref:phosphoribosylamine--glycine ligase, chloroplastic-like n=1 Tax=Camellia sinensis TaxID=4442 RepID=UPI001035B177|nr:phosphoribosylamine--glycine ligase, chloroplastic-like [Camellia sinensis]